MIAADSPGTAASTFRVVATLGRVEQGSSRVPWAVAPRSHQAVEGHRSWAER